MKTHELKTDPLVFAAVVAGLKTHEIRFDDRGFEVGDRLRLRETRASGAEMREGEPLVYTGRELTRTVSHIQLGYGLAPGWCILSLRTANCATEAPPAPVAQPGPVVTLQTCPCTPAHRARCDYCAGRGRSNHNPASNI